MNSTFINEESIYDNQSENSNPNETGNYMLSTFVVKSELVYESEKFEDIEQSDFPKKESKDD